MMMSEKRFRLDYEEDDAIFIVEDDDIVYPIRNDTIKENQLQKLVDKLNEQQAIINKLKSDIEETEISIKLFEDDIATKDKKIDKQQSTIEHLTKSRDKWSKSAKLHSEYFNCLEKAIEIAYEEKPYPKIEDIMNIYSKLEKEINDE